MEFNQIQLDALREIGSIAVGNAATSLSSMLGRRVNITMPNIMVEAVERVAETLGGSQKIADILYFSISGQIPGNIFLILPVSDSRKLVNILTSQEAVQTERLDEMGLSALKELGNITTGAYLRALAEGLNLNMKITYSIPGFASDMLGAIIDGTLAGLSLETGYAFIMSNEFTLEKVVYNANLIFIPEPKGLNIMLKALGAEE